MWSHVFLCSSLVVDDNVVLCRHVVCDIVIHDQSQESIEQGQVHFLRDVFELALEHHDALAVGGILGTKAALEKGVQSEYVERSIEHHVCTKHIYIYILIK